MNEWSVKKGKKKIVFNRLNGLAAKSKIIKLSRQIGVGECEIYVTSLTAAF